MGPLRRGSSQITLAGLVHLISAVLYCIHNVISQVCVDEPVSRATNIRVHFYDSRLRPIGAADETGIRCRMHEPPSLVFRHLDGNQRRGQDMLFGGGGYSPES